MTSGHPGTFSQLLFQLCILPANVGILPKQVTEEKVVAPLGCIVLNNVQMDRSNVR